MLNMIMNTLVNPTTVGASLLVVGAAGLVGGMFTDVLSYNIPLVNIKLGTLMYVVPLAVGAVTLSRRYLGMDVPFLGLGVKCWVAVALSMDFCTFEVKHKILMTGPI